MRPVGFFSADGSEAAAAYEEHVLGRRRPPEGIEIVFAQPDRGIGTSMRAIHALNRLDIPTLWRAIIRAPAKRKGGPVVSILAPRGESTAGREDDLMAGGIVADKLVTTERSIECEFPPGTPASSLVEFCAAAIQRLHRSMAASGEWQWTLRERGMVPE